MCISIELGQKIFWARLRIEPTGICILEVQRHRRMFQVEFEKKTCVYMQQSAPFFHLKRMACFSVKMKYLNMSVLTKNGSRCVLLFGQIAVG